LLAFYIQVAPYLINTLQYKLIPANSGRPIDFNDNSDIVNAHSDDVSNTQESLKAVPVQPDAVKPEPHAALLAQLTKREREVLDLIGLGYSNADIAKILVISEHTVNDYTKKIYRKLDVHSRHAAASIINRYE